jgi:hypothetical protein
MLRQAYLKAPYYEDMIAIVDKLFSNKVNTLSELTRQSIIEIANYFGLTEDVQFMSSADTGIKGASSKRLHDLCVSVGAQVYVTGHGAKNYLMHDMFEDSAIRVEYMNYRLTPYPQLHGDFTPYVSSLDLIANCGKNGLNVICSDSIYWKNYMNDVDK